MTLISLIACKTDVSFEGTLVGNPGRGMTRIAETKDLNVTTAQGRAISVNYSTDGVNFDTHNEEIDTLLDLLNPSESLELRSGSWSALRIDFEDGPEIEGTRPEGGNFTLQMPELQVFLRADEGFNIEEDSAYVIEVGSPGWLKDDDFDASEGEDVLLSGDNGTLMTLQEALSEESGLYIDENDNGSIDSQERDEGQLAAGSERQDSVSSEDPDQADDEEDQDIDGEPSDEFEPSDEENEFDEDDDFEEDEEDIQEQSGCSGGSAMFIPLFSLMCIRRKKKSGNTFQVLS